MFFAVALAWQFTIAPTAVDSARVESGRLVVEPVGVSFTIPPSWLVGNTPLGGEGCDPQSPRARRVITHPADLRRLSGPPDNYADDVYSALADAAFPVEAMVAHLGARGWRECDNTVSDLQMRVYVTTSPIHAISEHLRQIRITPKFRGYTVPVLAKTRQWAGWQVETFDWQYNCGDCLEFERFEVYSKRFEDRTVSLVFMYSPLEAMFGKEREAEIDQRTVLSTFSSR